MKKIKRFKSFFLSVGYCLAFLFGVSVNLWGQVTVNGAAGVANGTVYTTLSGTGGAFSAINANVQSVSNSIVITLTSATITETGAVALNAGNWNAIKIYPTVTCSLSGTVNAPLIVFNGADKVTIDGRLNETGTPKSLTITNLAGTTTATQTIQFSADAQNNTIQYCNILGSGTAATSGTISFLTGTVLGGNSNNLITNNTISSAADNKRNSSCIYSSGSASYPNTGNTITNNLFYNTLMRGQASYNIYLNADNNSWNISGNSFYETASFVPSANVAFKIIEIQGGYGYTISGNYLGGNAANCSGSFSKTNAKYNDFTGISLATSAGAASTMSDNTIQGFSWNNSAASSFTGISIGGVGIVNVTNNSIGSNTGNGSITYLGGGAAAVANVYGIYITSTGTTDCQTNKIGSITASNTFGASVNGIFKSATSGTVTISNNTIGSSVTLNSINSTTNAAQNVNGIQNAGTGSITISNNSISSLTNASGTGDVIGVKLLGGSNVVNANTIYNLSAPNSTTANMYGISYNPENLSSNTSTFSNNYISLNGDVPLNMFGVYEIEKAGTTPTNNIYNNTILLSGTPASGTLSSSAIGSIVTSYSLNIKNNLLINNRTNGVSATGSHYALSLASTSLLTSNYNNLVASGSGGILAIVSASAKADIAALQTATGGDANSINRSVTFAGTTDLSLSGGSISDVNLAAPRLAAVTTDIFSNSRASTTYMGANEPSSHPMPQSIAGGNITASGLSDAQLANTDITVSSGEMVVNLGKTVRSITVSAGAKLSVASGQTLTLTNLTLKSDASGTSTFVNDGTLTVTGTAAVEQYLATTRNWYVSSPVTNANAPAGYTYYKRNEAGSSWAAVSVGTGLTAGVGYIALPGTSGLPITFTTQGGGTLNSGNVTIPITYTPLATSAKGFNLIGNPYPSHLTWTKTFVDNNVSLIEPSIYYRTNAGSVNSGGDAAWSFKTYNSNTNEFSPAGTTNIIPPMQAFWIRAKASGNLILNSDLTKSHQTSNPLKVPAMRNTERQRVRLQVTGGTRTDETVLLFDANAANGYDVFDSPKFAEANSEVQIYTTVDTERLVMNGMKTMPLNQEIALGFVPGSATSFSLRANEISNLPSDVRVILKDNVKNTETDLTDGVSAYQFSPEASSENRFSLLFRAPGNATGIDKTENGCAQVFVNSSNQITIIAPEKSNYAIYNALGQLIEYSILNTERETINAKLNTGVYVVKVNNQSTRVIIK